MPKKGEEALLLWCQQHTKGYADVNVTDFVNSWKDGLAFCALINKFHPKILAYQILNKKQKDKNLETAFQRAEQLGIPRLLTKEDVEKGNESAIIQYLTRFYWTFKSQGSQIRRLESIYVDEENQTTNRGNGNVKGMGEKLKINPNLMRPGAAPPPPKSSAESNSQTPQTTGNPSNTSAPAEKQSAPPPKLEHLTKNRPAPNRRKPAKKIGSESPKKVDLKRSMTKRTIGPANSKIYESREQAIESMENKTENNSETKPEEAKPEEKKPEETPSETKPEEKKTDAPAKTALQPRPTKRVLPTPPKKSQTNLVVAEQTVENKAPESESTTKAPEPTTTTTPAEEPTTEPKQEENQPQTSPEEVPSEPTESDTKNDNGSEHPGEPAAISTSTDSSQEEHSTATDLQKKCERCDDSFTSLRCVECDSYLCRPCCDHLHSKGSWKNHPILDTGSGQLISGNYFKRDISATGLNASGTTFLVADAITITLSIPHLNISSSHTCSNQMTADELKRFVVHEYEEHLKDIDIGVYELGLMDPKRGPDYIEWLIPHKNLAENEIKNESNVCFADKSEYEEAEEETATVTTPDELQGYLLKQAGKVGSTKRRWFITQDNRLCYFKSKGDQDPIGVIPIVRDTVIVPSTQPKSFEIKTSKRVYKLQATSQEDMELWVKGLNEINVFYQLHKNFLKETKEGELFKKGGKNNKKGWKKRTFSLRQGFIYYYSIEASGSQKQKGKIPLYNANVSESKQDRPFCFQVVTKDRTFLLSADSEDNAKSWISHIQEQIDSTSSDVNEITVDE